MGNKLQGDGFQGYLVFLQQCNQCLPQSPFDFPLLRAVLHTALFNEVVLVTYEMYQVFFRHPVASTSGAGIVYHSGAHPRLNCFVRFVLIDLLFHMYVL